jgi:hypothetical protein
VGTEGAPPIILLRGMVLRSAGAREMSRDGARTSPRMKHHAALHIKSAIATRTERRLPGGWPGGILPPLVRRLASGGRMPPSQPAGCRRSELLPTLCAKPHHASSRSLSAPPRLRVSPSPSAQRQERLFLGDHS